MKYDNYLIARHSNHAQCVELWDAQAPRMLYTVDRTVYKDSHELPTGGKSTFSDAVDAWREYLLAIRDMIYSPGGW